MVYDSCEMHHAAITGGIARRAGAALLALGITGCPPTPRMRVHTPAESAHACVLIDTDVAFDDLRAIAALAGARRVVGVITTSGMSTAGGGAAVMRRVLASSAIPVAVGDGREASDDRRDDWVTRDREVTERLNGVIDSPSRLGQSVSLPDAVLRWTRGCGSIEVVVLGPWSSFGRYRRVLGDRLAAVYATGPDPTRLPEGARAPFNCRYDRASCREAPDGVTWVSLPLGAIETFRPDVAAVEAMPSGGVSGVVREALLRDVTSWTRFPMADDAVALRCVSPRDFAIVGRNDEPTITPEGLRRRWIDAVRSGR